MVNRNRSLSMNFNGHKSEQEQRKMKESIFELKEVQTTLRYEWPQCLQENANPIEMAVSLLDDTSVGMAYKLPEFQDLSKQTKTALRHVVNEHHDIFNNSIGSYHVLLSTLQDSQHDSIQIKEMLESATTEIHNRSDVLTELNQTSARYSEMIEILDAMDELVSIPDKIDQLIIDKKIHQVYDVISHGYKVAEQYNLWSLSAMSTTRSYLELQSNNLFDMIVDELQNEIYLKNVSLLNDGSTGNSALSWQALGTSGKPQLSSIKALITELNNLEQYIYNSANLDISEIADCFTEPVEEFIVNQLPKLHAHYSNSDSETDYSIMLDAALNDNSKSYHYIYKLLNTASKLNRLPQVLEILINSNQQELHGLINRTTEEAKLRNMQHLNKLAKLKNLDHSYATDMISGSTFNDYSVVILQDLFGSIFIKALAVLQKHKVVTEIVEKIKIRDSYNISHSFDNIWGSIRKELRALMINYTYDVPVFGLNPINGGNEINKQSSLHDVLLRSDLFKLEDVSYDKSAKTTEDMKTILQDMFPGFVLSDSENKIGSNTKANSFEIESPYIKNETFNAMVEVLVPKNIFNMRIILEFLLVFIAGSQRLFANFAEEGTTSNTHNNTALKFFNEFMKGSFLPRLKENLDNAFREYVSGKSNFEQNSIAEHENPDISNSVLSGFKSEVTPLDQVESDSNSLVINTTSNSSAMIFQNALDFRRLFTNACSVLNTSLTYRRDFSDLCLHFLRRFSDTYAQFYNELLLPSGAHNQDEVSIHGNNTSKPSLQLNSWMRIPALIEISNIILQQDSTPKDLDALLDKEIEIMTYNNDKSKHIFDITKDGFLDNDSINQVCYLLLTTTWILTWLPSMKKESNYTVYNDDVDTVKLSTVDKLKHDWCFLENGLTSPTNLDNKQKNIYLALNSDKVHQFNEIIRTFETIRDGALVALRYDLRCKAIYYIGRSFKEGEWLPSSEPGDADQYIGLYNKEAFAVENKLNNILNDNEKNGVFVGLPKFLSEVMIKGSYIIPKINTNGVKKILLNIFTLQQMLRNVMNDAESVNFTKPSVYYELFTKHEQEFLEIVKRNHLKFTSKEIQNLVRLLYSEKLADGRGSSFHKSKFSELERKITEILT